MTSVLSPWGIDERGEQLYRAVLRHPGRPIDDLSAMLGWPPQETLDHLRTLVRTRLVRDGGPDGIVGAPPDAAIEGLLAREEHRIGLLHHQVATARSVIPLFSEEHRAGELYRYTPVPLDVVAGDEAGAVIEDLTRTTTGDIVVLQPSVQPGLGERPRLRELTLKQLADGRVLRTVYPLSVLDDPHSLGYVRFWAEAGEEARFDRSVTAQVLVFGEEAAIVPAEWATSSGSDLVVRTPGLVAALGAFADCVWQHAVPAPLQAGVPEHDERRRLLRMLAAGAKDETLARHLDLSLRTVRRRVADLLLELEVTTRFQAGMEAVRRGWL